MQLAAKKLQELYFLNIQRIFSKILLLYQALSWKYDGEKKKKKREESSFLPVSDWTKFPEKDSNRLESCVHPLN